MLTSLKIKNVASYCSTGVEIKELKKVNFFFGFNGSGKSTIAKYLYAVSQNNLGDYGSCSQSGYDETKEEILVFDEKFTERNFITKSTLDGIFSLNETNKEIDNKIKANTTEQATKEKEKQTATDNIENLKSELEKKEEKLINDCFGKRKTFDTFSKIILVHRGSKKSSYSYIKDILKNNLNPEKRGLTELNTSYRKLYEQELKEITRKTDISLLTAIQEKESKLNELLNEVVVGNDDVPIGKMIKELGLKTWVEQGKGFLNPTNKVCPFCQKETIDENFILQLESYFDESYVAKKETLKREKTTFESQINQLIQNIQDVSSEYNENSCLTDIERTIGTYLKKCTNIFGQKITALNEKYSLESFPTELKGKLGAINKKIEENNQFVQDKENSKKQLLAQIWNYIASDCKIDIDNYQKVEKETNKKIREEQTKVTQLAEEIQNISNKTAALQKQTVNTLEAVTAINDILKNSGFIGFSIKEKPVKENNISQYYLARQNSIQDADVFKTLSEGERSFISFLYFYQLCLGSVENDTTNVKKKIIVIDDPVSSMDSQVLFIVSTLIHSIMKHKRWTGNCGLSKSEVKKIFINEYVQQVFILTHNLYFYKEVSLDSRPSCKDLIHFKVIKNNNGISCVVECKEKKLLMDDYSLMWDSIKQIKNQSTDDKNNNIFLANTFRRILDSYANFIGLGNDAWATVIQDDDELSTEYILKCAFISLINDESHKVSPFDSHYFQKIHSESPQKLFEVFESIFNVIGKDHYGMMMKV